MKDEEVNTLKSKCQEFESNCKQLQSKVDTALIEKEKLETEISTFNATLKEVEQVKIELSNEKEQNQKKVEGFQLEIESLQAKLSNENNVKDEFKLTIDNLNKEKSVLEDAKSELQNKIQNFEETIKSEKDQFDELKKKFDELESTQVSLKTDLENAEREKQEFEVVKLNLDTKIKEMENEFEIKYETMSKERFEAIEEREKLEEKVIDLEEYFEGEVAIRSGRINSFENEVKELNASLRYGFT